ncbi:MAG: serpin family protein [Sedimentisphaerales bacterium]|nr:serpin family protein [Sedimentisphaerales bacterium]
MKTFQWCLILITTAVIVTGCAAAENTTANDNSDKQDMIVQGNNTFALELYARLQNSDGNLFLSPYSISTALAMTYAGARSRTAEQMADMLHFPVGQSPAHLNSRQLASEFGKRIKDLNARGENGAYELTVANALWGQKDYGFLAEFLELVETHYDGRLNEVDFIGATETARQTINAWVEKKTKEKIKNLIPKGMLDSMTRLVLTNAIYFKGNWAQQFEEDRTREAPFTLSDGKKIDVPMMNQTTKFNYMETDTLQGLELPYVDDELSMIVLLPKEHDGLGELEQSLTLEKLSEWQSKLRKREVIVSIPKFKLTSQFSLASILKAMGMTDAFSGSANFSGMNGKRNLAISAVIHKAYVDVNEEGTEAAAATAVTMRLTSMGPGSQPPVFRADHPFLFLIRDNQSGSILFIGRLMNPKA